MQNDSNIMALWSYQMTYSEMRRVLNFFEENQIALSPYHWRCISHSLKADRLTRVLAQSLSPLSQRQKSEQRKWIFDHSEHMNAQKSVQLHVHDEVFSDERSNNANYLRRKFPDLTELKNPEIIWDELINNVNNKEYDTFLICNEKARFLERQRQGILRFSIPFQGQKNIETVRKEMVAYLQDQKKNAKNFAKFYQDIFPRVMAEIELLSPDQKKDALNIIMNALDDSRIAYLDFKYESSCLKGLEERVLDALGVIFSSFLCGTQQLSALQSECLNQYVDCQSSSWYASAALYRYYCEANGYILSSEIQYEYADPKCMVQSAQEHYEIFMRWKREQEKDKTYDLKQRRQNLNSVYWALRRKFQPVLSRMMEKAQIDSYQDRQMTESELFDRWAANQGEWEQAFSAQMCFIAKSGRLLKQQEIELGLDKILGSREARQIWTLKKQESANIQAPLCEEDFILWMVQEKNLFYNMEYGRLILSLIRGGFKELEERAKDGEVFNKNAMCVIDPQETMRCFRADSFEKHYLSFPIPAVQTIFFVFKFLIKKKKNDYRTHPLNCSQAVLLDMFAEIDPYLYSKIKKDMLDRKQIMLFVCNMLLYIASILMKKFLHLVLERQFKKSIFLGVVELGYAQVLVQLLKKKNQYNLNEAHYREAVFIAIREGHVHCLSILIKNGQCDINMRELGTGNTLVILSVIYNQKECLDFLIQQGANLNLRNDYLDSPVLICLRDKRLDLFKLLLDARADITDMLSATPNRYHQAVADIFVSNHPMYVDFFPILMEIAIEHNCPDLFECLLRCISKIEGVWLCDDILSNKERVKAIAQKNSKFILLFTHVSLLYNHQTLLEMLIDFKDLIKNQIKREWVFQALKTGQTNCVITLIQKFEIDVNMCESSTNNTLVMLSVMYNRKQCLESLIAKGANLNCNNSANLTPVKFCMQHNHPELFKLLVDAGVKIDDILHVVDGRYSQSVSTVFGRNYQAFFPIFIELGIQRNCLFLLNMFVDFYPYHSNLCVLNNSLYQIVGKIADNPQYRDYIAVLIKIAVLYNHSDFLLWLAGVNKNLGDLLNSGKWDKFHSMAESDRKKISSEISEAYRSFQADLPKTIIFNNSSTAVDITHHSTDLVFSNQGEKNSKKKKKKNDAPVPYYPDLLVMQGVYRGIR